MERRFQPITVEEPSPELAVQIVKGVKGKYEKHHGVTISDEAIETAVQLSVRYINDRYLPDKAFDIIDEACSKLKMSTFAVPPALVELTNKLGELQRKREAASVMGNKQLVSQLETEYNKLYFEYEYMQADYKKMCEDYKCVLTSNDVRNVVSQMTTIWRGSGQEMSYRNRWAQASEYCFSEFPLHPRKHENRFFYNDCKQKQQEPFWLLPVRLHIRQGNV